ncbi:hypothetical protein ACFL4Y_00655 [Gemmatimonadota bacterium]
MRRYAPPLLLLLLPPFTSCSSPSATFEVEVRDGVRHVRNLDAAWGEQSQIELELLHTIGGSETDEEQMLYLPLDATADREGNVYVLDTHRPAIRKYDPEGNFILDVGGEGSGPGEFRSSLCLDTDGVGDLYLSDMDNGRLSVFSPDGGFERVILLGNFFHFFCVLSDGRIVGLDLDREVTPPRVARLLDREGESVSTFGEGYVESEEILTFMVTRSHVESDSRDNVYVSFDHFNRIDKYSPEGTLLMSIERPLTFEVKHEMRMSTMEVEGELREYPNPSLTVVSGAIGVDGQDRLWVLGFTDQPEETGGASAVVEDQTILQFEIFDSDGVLLCRMPVPAPLSSLNIVGDRLLLIDAYTDTCVRVYRILG